MNILIVTAVYPPEPVVSARLSADLRDHLTAQGHTVHILCPQPSRGVHPISTTPPKPNSGKAQQPINHQSSTINHPHCQRLTRLPSYHCPTSSLIGRLRESYDFGRLAARWLQSHRDQAFDVVYLNMWPIFGPLLFTRAARKAGIPIVQHVMDVYPESLVTKLPKPLYPLCHPLLLALDRVIAQRCATTILLSEKIAARYESTRKIKGRVQVIRNWVDTTPFTQRHNRKEVCNEYNVPAHRFSFMYLGNISALAGLDSMIRAFAQLESDSAQLLIIGEGSDKASCQQLAKTLGAPNVLFRSEPDPAKVARLQSMADVFLLPTRKGGATHSTPSKCISYMLSAKPIIAAVDPDSDTAADLQAAQCAWICPPEDIHAIKDMMRTAIHASVEQRNSMGMHGYGYAMEAFDKENLIAKLTQIALGSCQP